MNWNLKINQKSLCENLNEPEQILTFFLKKKKKNHRDLYKIVQ